MTGNGDPRRDAAGPVGFVKEVYASPDGESISLSLRLSPRGLDLTGETITIDGPLALDARDMDRLIEHLYTGPELGEDA